MSETKPITAAGGVLFKNSDKEPQVALIYKRGVWDLPKGKLEKGEPVKKCAVREVGEELGLEYWPSIDTKLTDTYHEYDQDGAHYGKITYWYAMSHAHLDKERFDPETEEGIEKVQWYSLDEAAEKVGYQNLEKVLRAFRSWIKGWH